MLHRKPGQIDRWQLQERIKELTALHQAAKILRRYDTSISRAVTNMLGIIPPAWQYPDITGARITYCGKEYATGNFRKTRWMQRTEFRVDRGKTGCIEVCYLERRPVMDEGPFLAEERALISTLAELLRLYFHRCLYADALKTMNRKLEQRVSRRTSELLKANESLEQEINERRDRDRQLRALASALTLAEEHERRQIASNLHDHIGQSLALVRHKLKALQGNAMFSGAEQEIETIQTLTEQIIKYTRTLTVELSPPVLYELGLVPALTSLADQFTKKYQLSITVRGAGLPATLNDDIRVTLYAAVRELLTNIVKHAHARKAIIAVDYRKERITITVVDNGVGIKENPEAYDGAGFGLFSIRERLKHFGGSLVIARTADQCTTATLRIPLQAVGRR